MTDEEKEILKQAIANYQELWNDFVDEIDDGRWNRKEVENNIAHTKQIVGL